MTTHTGPGLVQNLGLELPIFSLQELVPGTLHEDIIPESGTFVRGIIVSAHLERIPLKEALQTAEEQFHKISDHCGAQIVAHEWGLIKRDRTAHPNQKSLKNGRHPDIPGYMLASKVERLSKTPWQIRHLPLMELIKGGIKKYRTSGAWDNIDLCMSQFICAHTGQATESPYLTDIDLMFWRS